MSGGRIVTLNAVESTITTDVTGIAANGVAVCTVTVRLKQSATRAVGAGLPATAVVLAVTPSTGVTITQPAGTIPATGTVTGSFVSSNVALVSVTATAVDYALPASAAVDVGGVAPDAGAGSVSAFTDISRDIASTSGGDTVTLTVADATGAPKVWFGPTEATSVVVVNATTVTCTVPANSAGVVSVYCGGVPLSNPRSGIIGGAFEYHAAPTTTLLNTGFEGGSFTGTDMQVFGNSAGGDVVVSSERAHTGTYAVKCTGAVSDTGGANIRNTTNINVSAYAALYTRYYAYFPQATIDNVQASADQIKLHLFRRQAGNGQPGWLMLGVGSAFADGNPPNDTVRVLTDYNTGNPPAPSVSRTQVPLADRWTEVLTCDDWNGSAGRSQLWLNGQKYIDTGFVAGIGSGNTDYRLQIGIAHQEHPAGATTVYIDNVFCGDGVPLAVGA